MPRAKHKRKTKRTQDNRDFAEVAFDVYRQATSATEQPQKIKSPAAVELGRLGGNARAKRLPADRLRQIAIKAAKARWSKKP